MFNIVNFKALQDRFFTGLMADGRLMLYSLIPRCAKGWESTKNFNFWCLFAVQKFAVQKSCVQHKSLALAHVE
jgi:hypothetical protein